MVRSIALIIAIFWTAPVTTETVETTGRGVVELAPFSCSDTPRSTVIRRVCYDRQRRHLLVRVGDTYVEYCKLPPVVFDTFTTAPSMGQFYRTRIAAAAGLYSCDRSTAN